MRTATQAWEAAVRSFGIAPTPRVRPSALLWFWYALWGPLPERHRLWVLYDATCSTWVLRYFTRIVAIVAPPSAAIALFLPASTGISVLTAVVTGGCAFLLMALWTNEGTEYRLVQAGWPWDTGPEIRERRATLTQRMASAARREQISVRRRS